MRLWWQCCTFLFTDSRYIKLTHWQANAMGAAMFVSYPTAHLCKIQHDWLTASQRPLWFQKCGSPFQNLMNISMLLNALVNNREELWLAESDIPPLREKCSGQASLPRCLPPCAETLAGKDGKRELGQRKEKGARPEHGNTLQRTLVSTKAMGRVCLVISIVRSLSHKLVLY